MVTEFNLEVFKECPDIFWLSVFYYFSFTALCSMKAAVDIAYLQVITYFE